MAFKIKNKPKFSEKSDYYLVDTTEKVYDPTLIKGWKSAVRLNMVYQISSENPNVIPLEKEEVLKNKQLKKEKFL
jgi:hypothetical protein